MPHHGPNIAWQLLAMLMLCSSCLKNWPVTNSLRLRGWMALHLTAEDSFVVWVREYKSSLPLQKPKSNSLTAGRCLQLVWAYVFLSGLTGMALTYYYDDEHNLKLLNILKYGLMLLGLGLVYCSTSMAEASATLCVLLLASVPATLIWDKRLAQNLSSFSSCGFEFHHL